MLPSSTPKDSHERVLKMYQGKKPHPALKHGGYAALGLLPGEHETDFNKLQAAIIEELAPVGPVEEDIVLTIVRLVWRKNHLRTFELVRTVEDRVRAIEGRLGKEAGLKPAQPPFSLSGFALESYENEEHKEAWAEISRRAWSQARKELVV